MQELTWVFATPNRKCTTIKLQSQITWEYRLPSKWWHPELHHLEKLTHRLTVHVILPQLYEPFLAIRWALYKDNQSSSCFALLLVAGMHFGSYQEHFGSLFSVSVMAFISCCLTLFVAEGFLLNTSIHFSLLSNIFFGESTISRDLEKGIANVMCYLKIIILSTLWLLLNCVLKYTFRTCIFSLRRISGNAPTVNVQFFSYFWCFFATTILWSFKFLVSLNLM